MNQWVCPSCGNQLAAIHQPMQCPGCAYHVSEEAARQFEKLGTEVAPSADDEAFERIDEAVSAQTAKTIDASSSDVQDFSKTVDVAATVKAADFVEEKTGMGEKSVRATLPDSSADEAFEVIDEAVSAQSAKTIDASSGDAEDFSKTVDVAATDKAADCAEEKPGTSEKTARATLPNSSADEAFELIDEAVSAQSAKTIDASNSNAEDFSKTVDVAATVKASDFAEEKPGTNEKTVRATLPDSSADEAFELLDKTIATEFEKTLDTATDREDAVRSTADEAAGQDSSFTLLDKTINLAVANTVDATGFAENPEYYQTQKTISEISEHGTVSSLSEMPKRILASSDSSNQMTDYQLEKELGKGSFGVVWRARQKALNRTVALKLLHDKGDSSTKRRDQTVVETKEQIRRRTEFLREAQFNGRLDHPNIVPIHELGVGEDGSPFYAMKEIRGISWRNVIGEKTLPENLDILKRVADAMSFAHSRNILHCDLKPDNVMLGEFGEVLVVDWGQAIDLAVLETFRPGGSPVYIPPEMAQYFCDTMLAKESSTSRSLVGKRSDTYLLGAILFEIISGFAPHPCVKGDTISDVLRRAARNEIREYSEFADDELMQIALHAMGAEGRKRYESVAELQQALQQYDSRQRSIEARLRAEEDLAEAKASKNYDAFQKARFGFEEATELWPENLPAQRGLRDTRSSFAKLALDNQDFDLGLGQLGETNAEADSELQVQLTKGRRARDRRKKLVGALLLTVAGAVALGLATNTFLINKNITTKAAADTAVADAEDAEERKLLAETKAEEAKQLAADAVSNADAAEQAALAADKQAKAAEQLALDAKAKAREFETIAVAAEKQADDSEAKAKDAQKKADEAKLELAEADEKAIDAREEADQARTEASLASQEAELAREEAKIVRFKNVISNIDRRIAAGEYQTAGGLLQGVDDRAWEWGRLMLLTHPEVQTLNPGSIISQSLSGDGRMFALATPENVQVRNVADFKLIQVVPIVGATAVALSADASQLAVALPADANPLALETNRNIKIYNLHDHAKESSWLSAQSGRIQYLEFSGSSASLLSVGEPDLASKGDRRNGQSDLMVWRLDADGWKRVRFVSGDGKVMKSAHFSPDGNRIVTAGDKEIHVMNYDETRGVYEQDQHFSYVAKGYPVINVAAFANDAGDEVMCGCDDSSIVLWSLQEPSAVTKQTAADKSPQQFVKAEASQPGRTAAVLDVFPGHSRSVLSLAIVRQQDGRRIMVSAGDDGTVLLWNLADKTTEEFRGHATSISYCALTPDGQTILSVSPGIDSLVRKIDLSKYKDELVTLSGHGHSLVSVSESTAKKTSFGSDDGRVYVYSGDPSPQLVANWSVSPQWKRQLSAGGKIFSESSENSIYVWDIETGNLEQMIDRLAKFKLFDVSRDGKTIVSLRIDDDSPVAKIDVWDVDARQLARTISGPANQQLSSLAVSPDGDWVVGGYSGLFVWSTRTGEIKFSTNRAVDDPQGTVDKIAFLGNSTKLITSWNQDWLRVFDVANDSGTLFEEYRFREAYQSLADAELVESEQYVLLKTPKGFEVRKLQGNAEPTVVDAIAGGVQARFSQANPHIVLVVNSSEDAETVVKWNWKSKVKHELLIADVLANEALNYPEFAIDKVEETSDGRLLVQARGHLVALSADLQVANLRIVPQAACAYAAYLGEDRAITLHGEGDAKIRFWKLAKGETTRYRVTPDGQMAGTYSLCQVSPDERYVLAVNESGQAVTVYDLTKNKTVVDFEPEAGAMTAICWSADSTQIVTGSETGNVTLWEFAGDDAGKHLLKTKELVVAVVNEKPVSVLSVALDREVNSILVIRSGAASLHRKAAEEWTAIDLPQTGETVAGDISPDGKRAVTASKLGSLTLWNTDEIEQTGQRGGEELPQREAKERALLELYQHKSEVRFVKFSLDGKSLFSAEAGAAGALIWPTLWDAPNE